MSAPGAARDRPKLVLAVIDALDPAALERAIEAGRAPTIARAIERGSYVRDCISTFPSVTPVAAATITTGLGPAEHLIPSMNWYHRGERRYVEYGSSFAATRSFGIVRSLFDTVYNMNLAHLTQGHRTVFEALDDAGLRTACTTYLIYRGRHRHEPSNESRYRRIAEAAQFRHAVWGPRELFYADLFDTQRTGCSSTLGMPGQRDRHAGCVGEHLVANDLFDFLLFSLPDNDSHSHREGPQRQPASIAAADQALERMMAPAGGVDAFLDEHALVIASDHTHDQVRAATNLATALADWSILLPGGDADDAEIAVCPASRFAQVYALGEPAQRAAVADRLSEQLRVLDGVDVVVRRGASDEAVVCSAGGELRFAPGGERSDASGRRWHVEGDLDVLGLELDDAQLHSASHPEPLGRLWSALSCPRAGDVLLSAAPGCEFSDWGGTDHVGGGSHGSLHGCDSLGALVLSGVRVPERERWSIADVAPLVLDHFGVAA